MSQSQHEPDTTEMAYLQPFDHEKMAVYQLSLSFATWAHQVASTLASHGTTLSDQLRRAAFSITLNISEGAGEFRPIEKARFYRMAARSATECAAILDLSHAIGSADLASQLAGKEMLRRIVAMLIRLEQSQRRRAVEEKAKKAGTGTGTGTGKRSKPR